MVNMVNTYSNSWYELFLVEDKEKLKKEIEFITRQIPISKFKTILDVACASGRHSKSLDALGYDVTGIDINADIIKDAKRIAPNVKFLELDMKHIEDLNQQFDAVIIMWQSFGYFDEKTNNDIIRQIYSVLHKGGRLIIDIYNKSFFVKHQGVNNFERQGQKITETKFIKENRLYVNIEYGIGFESDEFQWNLYTKDEIIEIAINYGFTLIGRGKNFNLDIEPDDSTPRMQLVFEK
ncbi:MAG: class I SAM-dependent methyltransferase [Candidatus Heimdallarchaeota archaeon]|nr:class I SAM-dependent methyltransferase [Candidatus Heimdallarchaeota archaeon]MDH5644484.1 class I SAM-dependent methyltransferase [Candidatus Heimdallarchaeota archaeon]